MRKTWKIIKYILLILFFLIILTLGIIYYLLGTNKGYQKVPYLINSFTPYEITYQSLEGSFFGQQTWKNIVVKEENTLIFTAEDLSITFLAKELLDKKNSFIFSFC
ncbi:hypothetical protein [Suttonella ornithocola]|uniref:hypothetical protein n=1 Tax=Suttonella ornithocola TaxID=279832 RepID=UPI0009321D63|nr:hypothetical protein [Suttonella ornithocola]